MIKMADSTLNLEDADIDTIEPEVQEMIDTLRSESGKIDRAQELLKSEYEDLKKLYGDHVPDLDELNYNEAIVNAIRGGASIREAWEHNNQDSLKRIKAYQRFGMSRERAIELENKRLADEKKKQLHQSLKTETDEIYISPEKRRVYKSLGYGEEKMQEAEKKYQQIRVERDEVVNQYGKGVTRFTGSSRSAGTTKKQHGGFAIKSGMSQRKRG
jgi:hypothetical protein